MKLRPHEEFSLWRRRMNFSQADVAERFNISQGYISHMEQGVRPVPKKIRGEMPQWMKTSEGDELLVRMRRQGLNMNLAVAMFKITHTKLLSFIRNEEPVPKEVWERLEKDEKRFQEYKAEQKVAAKPLKTKAN